MTRLEDKSITTGRRDLVVSLAGLGIGASMIVFSFYVHSQTLPLATGIIFSLWSYTLLTKWVALQNHSTWFMWNLERTRSFLAGEGDPGPFLKS